MYDVKKGYEVAKEFYAQYGIDVDKMIEICDKTPLSIHCWQGDDVTGFDSRASLSGGIQTTGNYPGKATTPEELMADIDKAFSLIPGKKKLNLHASYAIFENIARTVADSEHISVFSYGGTNVGLTEFNKNFGIDFSKTGCYLTHKCVYCILKAWVIPFGVTFKGFAFKVKRVNKIKL